MTKARNVLITNFKVNGKSVKFKIDIGEQCNVLQKKFLTASRRNQNTSPLTRSKRLMEEHQFRSRKMHSRIRAVCKPENRHGVFRSQSSSRQSIHWVANVSES